MDVEVPVPGHPVPSAPTPSYSPARFVPGVTTTAAVDPVQCVVDYVVAGQPVPTPAQPHAEAEAKLTTEIAKLWGLHKDSNAKVQRTRAELKAFKLELGEKLHHLKAILVRTGRGGGWASYLRSQGLPPTTADRYVAAHEKLLHPPEKKVTTGVLYEPTTDEMRQFTQRLLPKLCRMLTTQQAVYEFVRDVITQISVADGRSTEGGFEILKPVDEDRAGSTPQRSALPTPTSPKLPQRSSLTLLYSHPLHHSEREAPELR